MNINVTPIRINGNQPTDKTLLGRDQHELIEAAVEHYFQHLERMFHELKAEARWHHRRVRPMSSSTYTEAASMLGNKVAILRDLRDQIEDSHSIRIIPDEDQ